MESKQPQGGTAQADRAAQERARGMIDRVISDRYRIRELIAMGGMGAVYRGEHLLLKKRIAIKILHPETENLPELVKRFEREAIAGAHIQHPNVATATDFGKLPDGSYFLVIEYVKGKTLHQLLQDGPLPPRRAARLTRQLASALDAIHRLDIVHRDLKPRNIMVVDSPAETVKIIDLGLAKVKVNELSAGERDKHDSRASISDGDDEEYGNLTIAGTIFGTIAYLSPEAADGMDAVDARSDLYALGLMFYEMLSGKHPFTAVNPVELFMQHRFQPPPPIAERNPGVTAPPELEAIARKLLEKVPANRYQTGQEVAQAIDEVLREMGPPAEGEEEPPLSEGYDGEPSMRTSVPSLRPPAPSQRPPATSSSQKPPPVAPSRPPVPTLPSEGANGPVSKPAVSTPKPILLLSQPLPADEPAEAAPSPPEEIELTEAPAPPAQKKKSSAPTVLTVVVGIALGCGAAYAALQMQKRNAPTSPVAPQATVTATAAPRPSAAPVATPAKTAAEVAPAASASAAPEPAASAAVPAATLSPDEVDAAKKKFKNAFRFQDWRGASRVVIDLGKGAPDAFKDREFSQLVQGLAIQLSRENAESELLNLFADDLGAEGLDMLYAFVEGQGKAPIAVAAGKLLQDEKRLAKASPAMRIALDLRNASCVDKLQLLDRAQKDGDFRARLVLETLGRACFPQNPNVEKVIYDLRVRFPKR